MSDKNVKGGLGAVHCPGVAHGGTIKAAIGLALGNMHVAGGAAFLFMTNLLAIALSVTVVAHWYGFGGTDSPKQTAWQAGLIVGSFVLLSVPLGVALKRIALQSQVELAVRAATDDAAVRASGRVSGLRVDFAKDGVNVDAVMMVPHHINGLESSLEASLAAQLGRPVSVQVREVLTASDASFAQQEGTLAELRRNVAALQTAESGRNTSQIAKDAQLLRLQAKLLGYLGQLTASADGRHWTLQIAPASRMPLSRAQRIEREINATLVSGGATITVLPPLQPLPGIVFADDSSEVDADSARSLATIAWAVKRWHGSGVRVIGAGGSDALAQKRADAVATILRANGLQAGIAVDDAAAVRARVRDQGRLAARTVRLEIGEAAYAGL